MAAPDLARPDFGMPLPSHSASYRLAPSSGSMKRIARPRLSATMARQRPFCETPARMREPSGEYRGR